MVVLIIAFFIVAAWLAGIMLSGAFLSTGWFNPVQGVYSYIASLVIPVLIISVLLIYILMSKK